MNYNQKVEAVGNAMTRKANVHGVVDLEDLHGPVELNLLGMTWRGLLQFIRLNADVWGGEYRPAVYHRPDRRAFRDTERTGGWTSAKYILKWGAK